MVHPELGPISLICSFLPLIALPAQIRARSIPTVALVFWLSLTAFTRGINAIVWTDNTDIKLKVWCDITTRIYHGFGYGVPGAALCIMVQLESIASTRAATSSIEEKRRKMWFEYFMCYILPFIAIVLYIVVQGHRFDIYESFGCYPTYSTTAVTIILVWIPSLLMSVVSLVYGALVLYHFIRHRMAFTQYLSTCPSSISVSRYIRLMALSSVEIGWELAANIYVLQYNLKIGGFYTYEWGVVHSNFGRIARWPRFLLTDSIYQTFLIEWWIVPAACMAFFLFFGTGEEAMKDYRFVINWVRKNIFHQTIKESRAGFLPTYSTTSRGTVKTAVASPYSSKGGKKPWEDISINLPSMPSGSDDGDSMYKGSDVSPITPTEKTELEPPSPSSRFSTASDGGIVVSEPHVDTRAPWPSETAPSQTTTPTPSVTVTMSPHTPNLATSQTLRFGDIKITVEKEVV